MMIRLLVEMSNLYSYWRGGRMEVCCNPSKNISPLWCEVAGR
jgi:hypothetical protein